MNSGTFYFSQPLAILLAVTTPRSSQDWTVPQNDHLWQDGSKTLFDPCPAGWRVPKGGVGAESPWSAFGSDPYSAPFYYYINGIKQTALGTPIFVEHPNNGRRYEADGIKVWYPTAGSRDAGNSGLFGALGTVGNHGYYWASSVSGTNAIRLSFLASWLNPSSWGSRGHGYSVRCLRE